MSYKNKTLNPDDYEYLKPEVEFIESVLPTLGWYDMQHRHRMWEYANALKFLGMFPEVHSVLDAGSGNSPFPAILKAKGYLVECLEGMREPEHIKKWGIKWHMLDGVNYVPFPEKSYDFVTAISVIEHIENAEVAKDVLAAWVRTAKVGFFMTFDSSSDGSRRVPHHYRSYTMGQMEAIVKQMDTCQIVGDIDYTYYGDFVNNGNFGCMGVRRL